ncbi:MAG: hypothetical protein RLZZ316_168, partial [Bacteroidota bacterium]
MMKTTVLTRALWLIVCLTINIVCLAQRSVNGRIVANDNQQPIAGATVKLVSSGKQTT